MSTGAGEIRPANFSDESARNVRTRLASIHEFLEKPVSDQKRNIPEMIGMLSDIEKLANKEFDDMVASTDDLRKYLEPWEIRKQLRQQEIAKLKDFGCFALR